MNALLVRLFGPVFQQGTLARSAAQTGFVRLGGAVLEFASVAVLARLLGPEQYGLYSYALAVILLLLLPVRSGLYPLIVRHTSRAEKAGDWALLRGLWRWTNLAGGVTAVLLAAGGALFLAQGSRGEMALDTWLPAWAAVSLPPLIMITIAAGSLAGRQKVALGQIPDNVLRPLFLLALLIVWQAAASDALSAAAAMAATACAAWAAFAVGLSMEFRAMPVRLREFVPVYEHREWIRAVWPLALLGGVQAINIHGGLLLLGLLGSPENVGVYRVVVQCVTLVIVGQQVINMAAAPSLAALHAADDLPRLQAVVSATARSSFLFAVPVSAVLLFFGGDMLRVLFGEAFPEGHKALAILCAGHLVNVGMGPVGVLLNMTGGERAALRGVVFAALVNVLLCLLLIPALGLTGVALAASASLIVWNLLLRREVMHRLGIESSLALVPRGAGRL